MNIEHFIFAIPALVYIQQESDLLNDPTDDLKMEFPEPMSAESKQDIIVNKFRKKYIKNFM